LHFVFVGRHTQKRKQEHHKFNFFFVIHTGTAKTAKKRRVQLCKRDSTNLGNDCAKGDTSIVPLVLIFLSQFVAGIGVLLFFSLGGPYLDDNIKKTQSPMLFGKNKYGCLFW